MWTSEDAMLIWQAHKGKIESAAFSADGRLLATATGGTRTVYLWDPTTGHLVRRLAGTWPSGLRLGSVKAVAFARDAPLLAAGTSRSVTVWRTDSWELVADLDHPHARELAFGPGASPRLAASNATRVAIWDDAGRPTGGEIRAPDRRIGNWGTNGVAALDFAPDGRQLLTSSQYAAILWHPATGKRLRTVRNSTAVNRGAARFSPDGSRIALTHGKWAEVVACESDAAPPEDAPPEPARRSFLQAMRQTISSAYRRWTEAVSRMSGTTPLVRVRAGMGRWPNVWAVAWTANGESFLTAGNDGFVRLWDAASGVERKAFDWQIGKLYCVAFSPDGLMCAACGAKGQVVVWDVDE
jgi:WD40 repeat protein